MRTPLLPGEARAAADNANNDRRRSMIGSQNVHGAITCVAADIARFPIGEG
jgi:hypothetical protein